jgi:hypothetical protein
MMLMLRSDQSAAQSTCHSTRNPAPVLPLMNGFLVIDGLRIWSLVADVGAAHHRGTACAWQPSISVTDYGPSPTLRTALGCRQQSEQFNAGCSFLLGSDAPILNRNGHVATMSSFRRRPLCLERAATASLSSPAFRPVRPAVSAVASGSAAVPPTAFRAAHRACRAAT